MQKQHNKTRQILKSWTALCTVTFREIVSMPRKKTTRKGGKHEMEPRWSKHTPSSLNNSK